MLRARPNRRSFPPAMVGGFGILVLMVLGSLLLSQTLWANNERAQRISDYRKAITDTVGAARDAETGQRGFLLTQDPKYLRPYDAAVKRVEPGLNDMAAHGEARGRQAAAVLRPILTRKLDELRHTIALAQSGRRDAAIGIVRSDVGMTLMDKMRVVFERERQWAISQTDALAARSANMVRMLTFGLIGGMIAIVTLTLVWLRQAREQFAEVDRARAEAEVALTGLQRETDAREVSEGRVRQLQKMEAVGQLTGGIAHDFNNMLAVVIGGIELAQRRLTSQPEKVAHHLESAREGATRAASLTARLLAFSRSQPLAPKPVDLNKVTGGMSELLSRTLGDAIAVESVQCAGLWRCYADPAEIENVVLNLAVNARDAMPGGGRLTIEAANAHIDDHYAQTREVEAGQYVILCVTDTGTGMPQDVIDRAFDPFFTTKEVGKGTGLGLSQVFGFAKQSGGHVAIYSELGEGTTVKLYLPRFMGTADANPAEAASEEMPLGTAAEVILVVEDEQRVRHFAVDVLRELGYTAISAASPREALRALEEQPAITMLFTDIVMPDMNGRRLADLARESRPDLRVLYTTGYTRNAVVHNGMIDIGVAFLPKPYTIRDLARKIRDVLDGGGVNRTV